MRTEPPILTSGFRLFFFLGSAHAAVVMAVWIGTLLGVWQPALAGLSATSWHGHEMLFGFSMAMIAGFLLTAVRNWTKLPTLTGWPLAGLALLWMVPRVLLVGPASGLVAAAIFDVLFVCGLLVSIGRPIVAAKQARQAGIVSKVVLLGVGQLLFYGGVFGGVPSGVQWGLGTGLYMVLALMITIAGRVMVFFVKSTLPEASVKNTPPLVDRIALLAFLGLYLLDVFTAWTAATAVVAGLLAVLHTVRLAGWITPGLWGRSLLWVLHLAYVWIIVGFVLQALEPVFGLPPSLALHAYAAGGIGTLTIGMMARVSLGHTGRDVRSPRPMLGALFLLVFGAALARVAGAWVSPGALWMWGSIAAALWTAAFGALWVWGVRLWVSPRPT